MAYYVGDIPAEDIVIEPARNGEPIDLTTFDEVSITLHDPEGEPVSTIGFLATIDDETETVVIEWPTESLLELAGRYALVVTLEATAGYLERLAPIILIVQEVDGWTTLDTAREQWPDAREISDLSLYKLLELAKEQVLEYAPLLAEDAAIPLRYAEGQAMHARNIWNATKVDAGSGDLGDGTFAIRPFPLDWQIKQILRPKRGVPVVG